MQNFIASFQVTSEAQRTGPSRVHRLCLSGWQTFKFSYLCSLRTLPYRRLGREDIPLVVESFGGWHQRTEGGDGVS